MKRLLRQLVGAVRRVRPRPDPPDERLRRVATAEVVGIAYWREDGILTDANDTCLRIMRRSREDLEAGRINWRAMVLPEHEEYSRSRLAELWATGQTRPGERVLRRHDGTLLTILMGSTVIDARAREAVSFFVDITEQKRTEAALRESEARFALLFHANPLPMSIVSLVDGRHLDVNEAAVRHSGYAREEMLGKTKSDLGLWVHPEQREAQLEALQREGRVRDGEVTFRTKSGAVRQLLVNQERITVDGEPAVLSVSLDITDRKEAEREREELLRRERVLRAEAEALASAARLLATSLDAEVIAFRMAEMLRSLYACRAAGLFLVEPESGELRMAAVAGDASHLPPGGVIPRGHFAVGRAVELRAPVVTADVLTDERLLIRAADRELVARLPSRAVLAVPLLLHEEALGGLVLVDGPGRHFTADEVAVAEAFAGQAALAFYNARLFAQAQRQRAEAEAANRLKDEFLAMLGHELRNPVGAIASAARVLERAFTEEHTSRAREIITRQVQQLAGLMDDLLDAGRVATGKIDLARQPVDLAVIARRCLDTLETGGALARHRMEVATAEAWVHGDERRLEQVVSNLLANALRYTPPGGCIALAVAAEEAEAVLRVRDSGVGIEASLLPRIFDLFVQGVRPPDRAPGGLGIGLTLVRHLVELHGGGVEASSPGPGQGSTFTVRLPRVASAPDAAPPPAAPAGASARRILLVEDNADAREMLRMMLELEGHEVHEAADGPSGLAALLALEPDVALVDVGLPGFDGYELARRVRAAPTGRRVRLVAVTGYGQPEDRRRAQAAGFDAHLAKPVDPARLASAIAA